MTDAFQMMMMLPLFKKLLGPTRRRRSASYYTTTRDGKCKTGYNKQYVCKKNSSCCSKKKRPYKKKTDTGFAAAGMVGGDQFTQSGRSSTGTVLTGRSSRWSTQLTNETDMFSGCN